MFKFDQIFNGFIGICVVVALAVFGYIGYHAYAEAQHFASESCQLAVTSAVQKHIDPNKIPSEWRYLDSSEIEQLSASPEANAPDCLGTTPLKIAVKKADGNIEVSIYKPK